LFNELMDSSYDLAKKLLPFLARRRIPLIPENYRLFYDYFSDNNPELNRQLNDVLRLTDLFTPEVTRRLYRTFYDFDAAKADSLTKMGEKIGSLSQSLERNLDQSLNSAGHFKRVLTDTADQMEHEAIDGQDMRDLIDNLLSETQTALTSQTALADKIEKSNAIIAALTAELKDQTRLATLDELTQLLNRRGMSLKFSESVAALGPDDSLGLVMFDLDRFKSINDSWGHAIGDRVLILCAKILKTVAGDRYAACRFGGEEFVLLCPGAGFKEVEELAENVRRKMETTQITIRGENVPVTLSGGVSVYRPGEDESDLIARADKALYEAKNAGRNRVVASRD
jgi:diguanylate cyclase